VRVEAYEAFFGLSEPPFSLAPDPRFLFASESHSAALAQVAYALERREPLVVITGEIGTGKTLLCRTVLQQLRRKTFLSVVGDPLLERDDLLKVLLEDFGVISKDRSRVAAASRHDLFHALQSFLASLAPIQAHAVVIIDEAQHLQPDVLEEIRLLSNVDDERGTLLQIILVGQTDLEALLARPDLRQLQQRVTRRLHLEPLNRDEVERYITHRLALARGGKAADADHESLEAFASNGASVEFTPDAIETVSKLSAGLPRVVNLLCDRALEEAFAVRVRTIDGELIRAAAGTLGIAERVAAPALDFAAPPIAVASSLPVIEAPLEAMELTAEFKPKPAAEFSPDLAAELSPDLAADFKPEASSGLEPELFAPETPFAPWPIPEAVAAPTAETIAPPAQPAASIETPSSDKQDIPLVPVAAAPTPSIDLDRSFWGATRPDAESAKAAAQEESPIPVEPVAAAAPAASSRFAMTLVLAAAVAFGAVGIWLAVRPSRPPEAAPPPAPSPKASAPIVLSPRPEPPPPVTSVSVPGTAATTGTPQPQATAPAPPQPAAPAPADQAPPATGRFDIVVASFRTELRASSVANEVATLGLPIRRRQSEGWHQVVSGPFATRLDAEDAQRRLDRAGLTGTKIVPSGR